MRKDPVFHKGFSKLGYWEYIQDYVLTYGWSHDDSGTVRFYGDEKWAKWIVDKAAQGEKLSGCVWSGNHKDSALQYITNQDPTNVKDCNESKKWIEWWNINKDKDQLQWIRDGFAKFGINVSTPAKPNEYKTLLVVLSKTKVVDDYEAAVYPDYMRYNAFRWLRESGFNPLDYALKSINKDSSKEEIKGLYQYQNYYRETPTEDGVGILAIPCEDRTYYPYQYYGVIIIPKFSF
jgi:hypothetical protein